MSLIENGKQIRCDGEGCEALTRAPVGLRPLLSNKSMMPPAAEDWLFIVRQNADRHFCPRCAQPILRRDHKER
jgi:hypothetical protein